MPPEKRLANEPVPATTVLAETLPAVTLAPLALTGCPCSCTGVPFCEMAPSVDSGPATATAPPKAAPPKPSSISDFEVANEPPPVWEKLPDSCRLPTEMSPTASGAVSTRDRYVTAAAPTELLSLAIGSTYLLCEPRR